MIRPCEVFSEQGGGKNDLHAVEEYPPKKEGSHLTAGIDSRSERRTGGGGKSIGTYKSGFFKNSADDGSSRPRIFQAIKAPFASDCPRNYKIG